jgi:uncharacterized membrane protein YphA (DoxX/SURF4 family)
MFVACAVVSVLLAVMASASGAMKLIRHPMLLENMEQLELPDPWLPRLAAAELLGSAGLLIGLAVPALGIAAAIGLIAYFVGAVITHVRKGDLAGVGRPVPFLLLAIAALVLRLATM